MYFTWLRTDSVSKAVSGIKTIEGRKLIHQPAPFNKETIGQILS